jgi:hypothetical protein
MGSVEQRSHGLPEENLLGAVQCAATLKAECIKQA